MQPITRKERFLYEIVGWGETAPKNELTTEELFFAKILGRDVTLPDLSNVPRYYLLLAKIAGENVNVTPPTHVSPPLEFFLAKAAGMDVVTPTPQTREEIYWSNYTAIVEFEVENVPPLTYKAIEGTLKNYRIYGNTVNGESVGDRTANLFDYSTVTFGYRITWADGQPSPDASAIISDYIHITPGSYRVNMAVFVACYDSSKIYIGISSASGYVKAFSNPVMSFTVNNECSFIRIFTYNHPASGTLSETIMLNSGSTALPYEPYGYRVPVTVTNGTDTETTNIYLPEQIKMVGDEAEYIDFGEQKQHFADGTSVDVTLPALPTLTGTNTLSVGTEVQPSKVYIKGEKEREYT